MLGTLEEVEAQGDLVRALGSLQQHGTLLLRPLIFYQTGLIFGQHILLCLILE